MKASLLIVNYACRPFYCIYHFILQEDKLNLKLDWFLGGTSEPQINFVQIFEFCQTFYFYYFLFEWFG